MESFGAVRLIRTTTLAEASYSHAATTQGPVRPVFVAGACPLDDEGDVVAPGDVTIQAARCLTNLEVALRTAGAGLGDIIYTRVLVATSERSDLVAAWDVVASTFDEHDVPSTLHGVTVLGYPDQLVEIEAVAFVPADHAGDGSGGQ